MPTLLQIRQYVAKELGPFVSGTASSGSNANALVDTTWPISSTLAQDDFWTDAFVLRPSAALASDKVRLVLTYQPSSGTLVPDLPWTNAPVQGEAYELHQTLEPLTAMTDLINQALKRTMLLSELVGTPSVGKTRHSLTTVAPWVLDPAWVRQVGVLGQDDDRNEVDPYARPIRGLAVRDGSGVAIEHPGYSFSATDNLYMRVCKRAYDHCKPTNGEYGDQSGLSVDTDVAPVDLEWLGAAVLVEAWRRFSQILESASRVRMVPDRQEAAARFSVLTHQQFEPWPLTLTPRPYGGPSQRSSGGLVAL